MNNPINYKMKYQELKLKFINTTDVAWRLGYEAGLQAAQLQNSQQQLEQANQNAQLHAQAAGAQKAPGQESSKVPANAEEGDKEENKLSAHPDGSELDQHISELEGMLGKSEITQDDLKKVLDSMKLKKNEVKSISMPALTFSAPNMDNSSKEAIKIQNEIVTNVMKKWEDEEKRVSKDIMSTLNLEGLVRKE
jgi:hypothetical protein